MLQNAEIDQLDRLSKWLDNKYTIPGTSIRFGWDAILGLVPGIGDAVVLAPSAYLIYKGYTLGARKRTMALMIFNVGLDSTIGAVPLIGDVFDVIYKANRRNFSLLRNDLVKKTVDT